MDIVITTSHMVKLNSLDTVGSLKMRIQEQMGIPVSRQRLVLISDQSTHLDNDSRTLISYNMHSGSQVSLSITRPPSTISFIMDIFITMMDGTSRSMKVNSHDTVGSLKERIEVEMKVPASTQKLVFNNGQSTQLNDDTKSLSCYNIKQGSKVSLLISRPPSVFQVFFKNEKGQNSTYDITPEETVEKFRRRVQEREGVPANQQCLIHEGREMQGGKLSDYNVRALSTIFLTLPFGGRGHNMKKTFQSF